MTTHPADLLSSAVGPTLVRRGNELSDDLSHDETLGAIPVMPSAAVYPTCTAEVPPLRRDATPGSA